MVCCVGVPFFLPVCSSAGDLEAKELSSCSIFDGFAGDLTLFSFFQIRLAKIRGNPQKGEFLHILSSIRATFVTPTGQLH